jgi:hypothetical protein
VPKETKTDDTRNGLNFQQRFQIATAVAANTEPTGEEGFCRYINGMNDPALAAKLTAELGFPITADNVKSVRVQTAGQTKVHRAPKLENLRKVVEHFDAEQHRRRSECTNRLRGAIGKQRADERTVRTQMRGDGYTDEEISMAMYLAGAVVRHNGAGSTVEIPPR